MRKVKYLALAAFFLAPSSIAAGDVSQQELICMAENIYHEAGNQSLAGKVAVG